jgi:hypothetical protein
MTKSLYTSGRPYSFSTVLPFRIKPADSPPIILSRRRQHSHSNRIARF